MVNLDDLLEAEYGLVWEWETPGPIVLWGEAHIINPETPPGSHGEDV